MKELKINLQFFAEGGDGAGAGAEGSNVGESVEARSGVSTQKKGDLSNVIYGKASMDQGQTTTGEETNTPQKSKQQTFEDLIKGEYKEEFSKRTQGIIDERFKKMKGMEAELNANKEILQRLADKYGADVKDSKALLKAIDSDESFYEQEALEKGLTVQQLKEMKRLERENAAFKQAQEEREKQTRVEETYRDWIDQGNKFAEKYGMKDFDFNKVAEDPEFCALLERGISVETAYKATHLDDMIGGAMAQTAEAVRQSVVNSISNRSGRPSENGASSINSQIFKTDVNKLTKADRDEIVKRVARGEEISF